MQHTSSITQAKSNLSGQQWKARQVGDIYIVSLNDKASIVESLTDFVEKNEIFSGQITGIGAVNEAILRFFNPETKHYVDKLFQQQMEIANLSGNISEIKGRSSLHLHIVLGKQDYSVLAGHLRDARIRGAGEFFVYPLNTHVIKELDNEVGLNLYNFEA